MDSKSTSARKRRFFQFRLRTLLLMVLLPTPVLGWVAHSYQQHRRELAMLNKLPLEDAAPFNVIKNGKLETVLTA